MSTLRCLFFFISALCAVSWANAQDWAPSKAVRLIVPAQGGTMDILARLVAPHLQRALGQPVVVENKGGAGGNLGAEFVAKSAPDGTTLLVAFTAPITVNVTLFDKLPYDPQKDLAPITLAVSTQQLLVVHPDLPVKSVADLVRYAKMRPGKLSYASVAIGGASHLTMEMLKSVAGIDLVHVAYKGAGPAVIDLLAGNVQVSFLVPGNVLPHLKAGKLRLLASTGRNRFPATTDTPTMIESGFRDFEAVAWIGFMAPGQAPRPIIDRYHREFSRILQIPEVHQRLTDLLFEIVAGSPEQFADYIRWETAHLAKVIRATGVKPE